jgi:protein-tyrosine-phosphatase
MGGGSQQMSQQASQQASVPTGAHTDRDEPAARDLPRVRDDREGREVIVVVCAANATRSPLAVAILRRSLARRGRSDITVLSSGLQCTPGQPATPEAMALATERGLDLSDHRSRSVEALDWSGVVLALTMTEDQRTQVQRLGLADVSRTFTLPEFARLIGTDGSASDKVGGVVRRAHQARPLVLPPYGAEEVPDPTGKSPRHLQRTARQLEDAAEVIAQHLRPGDRGADAPVTPEPTGEPG